MISEEELNGLVDSKLRAHIYTKFKHYHTEDLIACFTELLKYLYLSSKYPVLSQKFIPVTQEVDEFWHAIILQTLSYQKLCNNLPGRKMLHHESLMFGDYKNSLTKEELVHEVLRWLVVYVRNFGDMKKDRIKYWFFINIAKKILGITLDELNQHAKNDTYFKIDEPQENQSSKPLE